MTNEGERPRSSWQSWVRSTATRRSAPPDPDLDVELEWREGGSEAEPAPAGSEAGDGDGDGLDAGLSWGPAAAEEPPAVPRFPDAAGAGDETEEPEDDEEAGEDGEYAPVDEGEGEDDLDGDDDGELLPAVPLLPSIAGRVEALSGLLRSISMRVDGLTAVTDVYRANVTDRIDEYTETVLQLSRQSDQALDEHRRGTERAIGELRRTASDRGEAVGQLVARVEELATEVATLRELLEVLIDTMPASAEGSGAPPLTRADLDASVDVIADAVAARIDTDAIVSAVVAQLQETFEVVDAPPQSGAATR